MITIGYSTRKSNPEFSEYLIKSSGYKKVSVIEKVNNGEKSLSEIYNEILSESKTDIVVLCHDDIYFDTTSWYNKLMKHFEKTDYGILGVAGTPLLPESGKWWEDRRKMVGIVNHEHNGKKWESKYSESLQNSVFQTVIVDGLFIAVSKKRLKKNFNEEFKGFHFYDIPFCLENHLEGVKVGVITNIRITHRSIGQTNEQWELNRQLFENKYKEFLPIKLPFDPTKKLKVLISCLFFRTFTGSEIYVFELAKGLMKLNCDVTILSQIGGPLTDMATKIGIKCLPFEKSPGYKIGDGNWGFETPEGFQVSTPNMMYKLHEPDFDIIHIQHKPVAERMIQFYPDIEKIYTIHSEVISLEEPITHPSIKKYIAIRPEIKDFLIDSFEIDESQIEVIYNPVDNNKFKASNKEGDYVLFVGTVDYLRKESIIDLVEYTKEIGKKLLIIGENKSNYLDAILHNENVEYLAERWDIEKYVQGSFETAGIQLGRTTIEGWMCGKPSWIYKVDNIGNIISKDKVNPPDDISKFYSDIVTKEIKNLYLSCL
jgi:glycosyltransferase involved in cell wall biosynthesis